MELSEARGRLVAIGGGDIREGDAPLLKEFIKLARGPRARIVVMTVATDRPEECGDEYREALRALGAAAGEGEAGVVRYAPPDELRELVDRLAQAYAQELVQVTELIHSRIDRRAQRFADAFRFRKE